MELSKTVRRKHYDLKPDEHVMKRNEIEQVLGHGLPPALADLLRPTGAPTTFEGDVRIKVIEPNQMTDKEGRQRLLVIFGMTTGQDGIVAKHGDYRGRFARRCTPIAEDGMGNLFVIDAISGQIKFWHHECPEGEASPTAMTLVAENFEDFVSGLEVVQEVHDPELLRGVKSARFDF